MRSPLPPLRAALPAVLAALALPHALHAQTPALEAVVVTATRTPQALASVLSHLRVMDAQTIRQAGPVTLTELLQAHGGVEIAANGGPGQLAAVFIRGANSNQVVVLIDGVRTLGFEGKVYYGYEEGNMPVQTRRSGISLAGGQFYCPLKIIRYSFRIFTIPGIDC